MRKTCQLQESQVGPVWYESPLLAGAGVPHAFSTRLGGVSPPPFDSLNLGNPNGYDVQDLTARIQENYRLLMTAIGAAERTLLKVHQMHGCQVAIDGELAGTSAEENFPIWNSSRMADAIVTTNPHHLASVRVADCVPVLLSAADGSAVAAVHAGWRGVVGGVVKNALEQLRGIRPNTPILAAIGPCIGMEAFEVGPEVLEAFETLLGTRAPMVRRFNGKGNVDLRQCIAYQLQSAGVSDSQIDTTDRCTARHGAEFFSHRRDKGLTGRMAAMIGTKPINREPPTTH